MTDWHYNAMNTLRRTFSTRTGLWIGLMALVALTISVTPIQAEEFDVKAELVWGTDEGKPEGRDLPELDESIKERFIRKLRWKNYYVVKSLNATIPESEMKTLALSRRCSVEVRQIEGKELEVKIHSLREGEEPKLVKTDRISIENLKAGHALAFAGDSKDNWDDAWFVVLTAAK